MTVQPGVVIRNGKTLDEPFIAEDPDYDMQVYQGEPLKHDYSPPDPNMTYRGNVNGDRGRHLPRLSTSRRPPSRRSRSPPAST